MNPFRPLILLPWLVLLAAPQAAAAPGAASAPPTLADAGSLLMLDESPLADACNTYPVAAAAFETWSAWGRDGEWTRVRHDGADASPGMLERAVLEAEGQAWSAAFVVAKQCDKEGGFCACASLSIWTGTNVWCMACCPADATPFCFCDSLYVYASCSCGSFGGAAA